MAVSTFPTWRSREGEQRHLNNWRSWYEVRASGAGGESYLVLKKDFADEEDYTEAGDSELFFVQVQRKKSIDKKSKLADKVSGIEQRLPLISNISWSLLVSGGTL